MEIQPAEILKWVGLVFAAGFVGYFGRYLSMLLLERIHKKRSQQTPADEATGAIAAGQDNRLEESRFKLEKKRAKQEAKKIKKEQKK